MTDTTASDDVDPAETLPDRNLVIGEDVEEDELPVLDIEEEIAHYDNPSKKPTESERHAPAVTPRAFLTEVGYDLPGTRLPPKAARILLDQADEREAVLTRYTDHAATVESSNIKESPEDVLDTVDRDGYIQMEVFRIDADPDPDQDDDRYMGRCGDQGYLIRYVGPTPENAPSVSEVHDRVGYYYGDREMYRTLIDRLFRSMEFYDEWEVVDVTDRPGWVTRKESYFLSLYRAAAFPERLPDIHEDLTDSLESPVVEANA